MIRRDLLAALAALLLLSACQGLAAAPTPPAPPSPVATELPTSAAGPIPSPRRTATPWSGSDAPPPTTTPLAAANRGAATAGPPTVVATPAAAEAPSAAPAAPPADFSGELAWQTVKTLAADIGSRPAGSPNAERAAQFLQTSFAALGYETSLQEFPLHVYVDNGSALQLVGGHTEEFSPNTVYYSPGGEVEAEVTDAGLGYPTELAAARGKIALIRRGELRFQEKVSNAAAAGAIGVILYNNGPGNIYASLFQPAAIPAVMLSGEEGSHLRELLAAGPLRARLRVDGGVEERKGINVIARRAGSSGRAVVLGAHFDSVPTGPGANDNGSGTAVLLETARVMAARAYPHDLVFVAFDGEELGLLGSEYYVEHLSTAERQRIVGMVNLDMLSVGDLLQFAGSDALVEQALHLAGQRGWRADRLQGALRGASDHASFLRAGIEAVFIYRSDDPRYHSPQDTVEHVPPENLAAAGTLALGLLDFLAGR